MKKLLAVAIALALVFSCASVAFAATNLVISAENISANPGDTIEVPLNLTQNSGFSYMKVRIVYDTSSLELLSMVNGTVSTSSFSTSGNAILWDSDTNAAATGTLATCTFKIKDSATAGSYSIEVNFIEAWDIDENDLTASVSNATLTVNGGTSTPTEPTDGENKDVIGSYEDGQPAETVYQIDISWGSMEFTYTGAGEGTWNPDTHTFSGGTAAGWSCDTDANKVTVTNHSNTAISATLSYAAASSYSTVTGSFSETSGVANDSIINLATAEGTTVANAPKAEAFLQLSGALNSSVTTKTVIGTATVTLN